ncbi:hypothetical protein DY000_02011241 [Brassica cretica]|uniref:Uncharacterized protein n=1 Tax=Brassica cretica TaxID=69181 RepID=A0ABQ7D4E2_BRACR|nr:hypothetical protein DY000_02011241 [Brassica cretica]
MLLCRCPLVEGNRHSGLRLVNSDGDSWDAFPNNLVYVLNGCVFCFSVGVLLKRGFAFSVYNMNILLEGLCKNLEYGKTVTLLREVIKFEFSAAGCWDIMPPHGCYGMQAEANRRNRGPTLESEGEHQTHFNIAGIKKSSANLVSEAAKIK